MYLFQEEGYISRIYYESMRDNFEGYAWDSGVRGQKGGNELKKAMLEQLKADFELIDPLDNKHATLGQLFKIELALIWLVPESALRARYWTIEDRFRRVVPTSVVASYEASFKHDPAATVPEETLRQRARNLLDVIHANYLINLARENSIKRLMTILALTAAFILCVGTYLLSTREDLAQQGLVAIIASGMFGAMISIIQRLQKATSRDAMVEDGIFELIGLRVGWVSVLMSIAIGGVFALFLYVLVVANMLDLVLPDVEGGTGDGAALPDPAAAGAENADAGATAPARDADGLPTSAPEGPQDTPARPPATPPAAPPATPPATLAETGGTGQPGQRITIETAPACTSRDNACKMWADYVADALGLRQRADFYKMIGTAFVAGFAERFVPDIINRLGKQNPGVDSANIGGGKPGL